MNHTASVARDSQTRNTCGTNKLSQVNISYVLDECRLLQKQTFYKHYDCLPTTLACPTCLLSIQPLLGQVTTTFSLFWHCCWHSAFFKIGVTSDLTIIEIEIKIAIVQQNQKKIRRSIYRLIFTDFQQCVVQWRQASFTPDSPEVDLTPYANTH